ncbi:MAG TPA: aspartate aminotransferase family protein [Gemmatimonadales bacterium]|jgi:glutamate-1-semialdehyde 2,1-aminomutase|nr:aspartate aminotransferase family protein [Gemmatimonadales bacterium]
MDTQVEPRISSEEEIYRLRTTASRRFFMEAREYLPGGDSRSTLFYQPYPAVMDRGEGCWLYDLDGNRLLDFTGNHSSLVHGYGHPAIVEAVQHQLGKGTCFPGSTEPQLRLAKLLCERIPSVEQARFTSSGTEASMNAIRAARAFTGRARIAKVEGGYHGLAADATADVVVLPFNDIEAAAGILEAEGEQLAAVIVEPLLGSAGMIPAERDYLEMLREITRRLDIILIFDEVVSFRIAAGGAQEYFGVVPDLTCLGKLIGGGFPLGAFGGRADIMALFDPTHGPPTLPHPGSHNANPIGMVAGAVTLELLSPLAIELLNARGTTVRRDLAAAFADAGIAAQITGLGSLFAIHLTGRPVRSSRDTLGSDTELRHRIFLGLFNESVQIDPRGVGNVSTAIGQDEVSRFGEAIRSVLSRMV